MGARLAGVGSPEVGAWPGVGSTGGAGVGGSGVGSGIFVSATSNARL